MSREPQHHTFRTSCTPKFSTFGPTVSDITGRKLGVPSGVSSPHGACLSSTSTSSRPKAIGPHAPARSSFSGARLLLVSAVPAKRYAFMSFQRLASSPKMPSAIVATIPMATIGSHTLRLG